MNCADGHCHLLLLCVLLGCGSQPADVSSRTPPRRHDTSKTSINLPRAPVGRAPLPGERKNPAVACAASVQDWFEEMTSAGVNYAYHDGSEAGLYTLLEVFGGGGGMLDFDRDGDLDLFFTGGGFLSGPPLHVTGRSGALFRNEGNWQFRNVTLEAGLDDNTLYAHGCAVGDFDRDGFPDLLVAGFGGCRLFRNLSDGTFQNVTESSGLSCPNWNVTAAWADIDRDGGLDLYVVTYAKWPPKPDRECINPWNLRDVCPPILFDGEADQLWRNRGDGTFEDVSEHAGVGAGGRGLGIIACNLDDDDWIDFYVVNDAEENVLLYGKEDLTFESAALVAGAALSERGEREGSMGVDVGDYDGDGEADLFYTNYTDQDSTLLRKVDRRGYMNVNAMAGIAGTMSAWVGFGTGFADWDGDGWLDLFVANGHVDYGHAGSHYFQPAQLFRNMNGKRFVETSSAGGPYFRASHAGRGAAVGDLDNDGGLDLVIVHQNAPSALLRNRRTPEHWLRIELRGMSSNPDAVGARVVSQFGERTLTRWVKGGGSYLSNSDQRIVLPTISDAPHTVTVRWPSGATETFSNLAEKQTHVLVEGIGKRQ